MNSNKPSNKRLKRALWALLILTAVIGLSVYYILHASMHTEENSQFVYIDNDDNIDSVYAKVGEVSRGIPFKAFKLLCSMSSYKDHVHKGRYGIKPGEGALSLFQNMKKGEQTPLNVTVPSVRTLDKLAAKVSAKLEMDSTTLLKALTDPKVLAKYGTDTTQVIGMFLPNTYSMYWDCSVDDILSRMQKESDKFWDGERSSKAKQIGLTRNEVLTLASIVAEETNNSAEKPTVAGLYINRLHKKMLLQADPTVKYALKNFGAKRVYRSMLSVDNPYNTYKYAGLPPGPIRNANADNIDAVLNYQKHDYLYMCAKETFDGTHNFATSMAEHEQNARRYANALNERGIK